MIIFTILVIIYASQSSSERPRLFNPGVKFGFPEKTLTYMSHQIFPWVEEKLKEISLPSFSGRAGKRGHIEYDIENGKITEFQISNPTYEIMTENLIRVHLPDIHIVGNTYFHYSVKVIPHIHGHGTLSLNLLADLTVLFGAKIDSKHRSNIEIITSDCVLKWKAFNIDDHGGLHRIYNDIIHHLTSKLESTIGGLIEKEVPEQAVNFLQPIIDSISFSYPIGLKSLDFSYKIEEILFNRKFQYLMLGSRGCLLDGSILPPGEPGLMPEFWLEQSMVHVFFSEWAFTSSIWSAQRAGLLRYIVHDSEKLPVHLNTESLGVFIPGLKAFGDKEIQIVLSVVPETSKIPTFHFSPKKIELIGSLEAVFHVVNSSTEIIDAFQLEVKTALNGTVFLSKGIEHYSYKVSLFLGLENLNISLIYSKVGIFDPVILQNLFRSVIEYFVLPNLNKYFLSGIPIPTSKYFHPKNPKIQILDHYFVAELDFDFFL